MLCGLAIVDCATAAGSSAAPKVADRAACSSLIECRQPTEKALQAVAGLGYRGVDLSCMSWASHVSVPKLLEDFDKEAARVEAALAASGYIEGFNAVDPVEESRKFLEWLKQVK